VTHEYVRLIVERQGPVGWIIFNRPERRNAIDVAMFDELERAWTELEADDSVAVIVNTGAGEHFQSGADVNAMSADRDALKRFSRQTRDADLHLTAWHNGVTKPVIAAVNGVCAGGGLHFVADADIVIAASDAEFLDPHVSIGQATAYEGIALALENPAGTMLRMALVGAHERMDVRRAHQLGWVSQVVDPPDRLREAAQALAELIASNPIAQQRARKAALWAGLEVGRAARRTTPPEEGTD